MAARQRNTFSTIVIKIGTNFLTAALRKTEVTARSAEQLPQNQGKERVFNLAKFARNEQN
jgi:phosphoribosyl-dephospho-CoA transferase